MEPELQRYFDNYDDLFLTDGWKQLVKELSDNANVINSVEATKDSDDLQFRKGQLNIIASIVHFQDIIRQSQENSEASNAEDI